MERFFANVEKSKMDWYGPLTQKVHICKMSAYIQYVTKCVFVFSRRWGANRWTSSQPATTAHSTFQCYQHTEDQQLPRDPWDAATEGGGCQTSGCQGTTSAKTVPFKRNHSVKEMWMLKKRLSQLSLNIFTQNCVSSLDSLSTFLSVPPVCRDSLPYYKDVHSVQSALSMYEMHCSSLIPA